MSITERIQWAIEHEIHELTIDLGEMKEILELGGQDEDDREHFEAFARFLRALTGATSVADINLAAGELLQDLGEEPDDAS